ncbi:MAG TPA: hypothetical protein DEZ08_03065 [Dehalococcoidia bacterium]|jgi:hypothetical protein|nr:hypothetical protein [Dehalococcoidia bacterium]|tara:strand:+ start:3843 stop:4367 length:525 start_codon:yes stop_codon:yes gene_type:complete
MKIVIYAILPLILFLIIPTNNTLNAQDSHIELVYSPYKLYYHQSVSAIALEKATVTIQLFEASTNRSINGADLKITVKNPTTNITGWAHAVPLNAYSNIYNAELNLKSPGIWQTSLTIDGELGKVSLPLEDIFIRETPSFTYGTVIFWAITLIIVIGAIIIFRTAPKRRSHSVD